MNMKAISLILLFSNVSMIGGGEDKSPSLDVDLQIFNGEYGRIINIQCKSDIPTMMCTVEFLLNNITVDTLRRDGSICYHVSGECKPSKCTCSGDCRTFSFNYTDSANPKTFFFGCTARFEDEMNNTLIAEKFKYFDGTVTVDYMKETKNGKKQSQSNNEEKKEDSANISDDTCQRNAQSSSWMWLAIVELMLLVIFVVAFVIYCQKIKKTDGADRRTKGEKLPLLEHQEEDGREKCKGSHHCHTCHVAATCAICTDCETRYCEICSDAHIKYYPEHLICQMQHVFTREAIIKCKVCLLDRASTVCSECNKIICIQCAKHHSHEKKMMLPLNPGWIRKLTVVAGDAGKEFSCVKIVSVHPGPADSPICISGLAFLSDGRIVVADTTNNLLQVYKNYEYNTSFPLIGEPRGIASMSCNKLAVAYGHLRKVEIYKCLEDTPEKTGSIDIGKDKPFAISHDKGHFAIEVNEGENGIILITTEKATLHRVRVKDSAYFTGNTIRVALDFEDKKVFISAMSKKSVSCVTFSGEILWVVNMPSPRSMVLSSGKDFKSLIVASRRCSAVYRLSAYDGNDEVLMAKDIIDNPRYIAIDDKNQMLCIQVGVDIDVKKLLIYDLNTGSQKDISKTTSHETDETH